MLLIVQIAIWTRHLFCAAHQISSWKQVSTGVISSDSGVLFVWGDCFWELQETHVESFHGFHVDKLTTCNCIVLLKTKTVAVYKICSNSTKRLKSFLALIVAFLACVRALSVKGFAFIWGTFYELHLVLLERYAYFCQPL